MITSVLVTSCCCSLCLHRHTAFHQTPITVCNKVYNIYFKLLSNLQHFVFIYNKLFILTDTRLCGFFAKIWWDFMHCSMNNYLNLVVEILVAKINDVIIDQIHIKP